MRTKQSKANREARAAGKARQVRSSALGKLIIMLAVVAAIVFGVAIFFKVNTIEIQGNTVYSADQIIEASQIQQGDNLLTVNKALAVGNIKAALPYVEDVSIARSLPDGIIIQVRESVVSFAVMTDTKARAARRLSALSLPHSMKTRTSTVCSFPRPRRGKPSLPQRPQRWPPRWTS